MHFNIKLQSHTRKYRGLQENPCNENRIPAMRTGFPVMKTDLVLLRIDREFLVSLTGFGFAGFSDFQIEFSQNQL